MKKIVTLFTTVVLCLFTVFGFAACGGDDDDNRTKVRFYFYQAGYGDGWAQALVDRYNAIQDEVKIVPYGDYDMDSIARNEIIRGTDVADIYTLPSVDELARKGLLEELSGLYGETVETIGGTTYTLDDLVEPYAKNAAKAGDGVYGVPWFGNFTGILYNVSMFENNGWQLPSTMTEFFALCKTIRNAGIDPLVFCGSQDQGYIPTLLNHWLWQAEGDTNMAEFLKFENAEGFKAQEASRTKIYQTVARMVKDPDVYKSGSAAYGNQQAQREFILGNAAMIVNGAWMVYEMEGILAGNPNFRMAMMPLPHINDDKKGRDGTDTANVMEKNSNHFVIPAAATHKEEAKKFLLWMSQQENLQTFADECNGMVRPYRILQPNTDKLSEFGKSVYNISTQSRPVVYESNADIWRSGKIGLFSSASGEYVTNLSSQNSLEAALARANELAKQDYENAVNSFRNF